MGYQTKILGTGRYLPPTILTNEEISKRVDTNHQWIVERTGIHERRIGKIEDGDYTSGMAAKAAKIALKESGLQPNDIDFILFTTTMADVPMPNAASFLQVALGITNGCACIDINAACTGFTYGFVMADSLIRTGAYKKILLIGADMTSGFNNWDDRGVCILFGDGAGAAVLGRTPEGEKSQLVSQILGGDGTKAQHLILPAGGTKKPLTVEVIQNKENLLVMDGREVFKAAVKTMAAHCETVLKEAEITLDQVDWFLPHQANLRIIEAVATRLNFPLERTIINVDKYANTSSATVPIALDEAIRDGRIKRGQTVLIAAFGAGLTSGAVLFKY
jgi:3-oxoacyl-[acyl-carrier-protein] synthase-3